LDYAWEKRNVDDSFAQSLSLLVAEIAKSFSAKSNKKEKCQTLNIKHLKTYFFI